MSKVRTLDLDLAKPQSGALVSLFSSLPLKLKLLKKTLAVEDSKHQSSFLFSLKVELMLLLAIIIINRSKSSR